MLQSNYWIWWCLLFFSSLFFCCVNVLVVALSCEISYEKWTIKTTNSNNNGQRNYIQKGLFRTIKCFVYLLCCLQVHTANAFKKIEWLCVENKVRMICRWSWAQWLGQCTNSKAEWNNERQTHYGFGDSFVEINAHFNPIEMLNFLKFVHFPMDRFFFFTLSLHTKASSLLNFMLIISKKEMTIVKTIVWLLYFWCFILYEKWSIQRPQFIYDFELFSIIFNYSNAWMWFQMIYLSTTYQRSQLCWNRFCINWKTPIYLDKIKESPKL